MLYGVFVTVLFHDGLFGGHGIVLDGDAVRFLCGIRISKLSGPVAITEQRHCGIFGIYWDGFDNIAVSGFYIGKHGAYNMGDGMVRGTLHTVNTGDTMGTK